MYDYPNICGKPEPETTNAIGFSLFDRRSASPYFRDLREFQDDRRILRNPHKGWYWHYIDNGYLRDNYRVRHDPEDHLERFPGLNHLYLRFDWGDIEKEKGVYDWSYIYKIIDEWSQYDYRFSMRFVTYEGDGSIPFATPEYVFKEGARGYSLPGGRLEPDYSDPIFLENLERFLDEAGSRFNGHPLIELVDLGTFGTWGEGHTGNGSDIIYPADVIRTHIDLTRRYFPDTFVLLNDDHINHRWSRGWQENMDLVEYAVSRGLGLEDDSVCVRYYAENCGYNTLRSPWLFDKFYDNAPVVLEFEHYTGVAPEIFKGGFPFIDAMQRTGCTFAGFHGYPVPWLEREPYLTEYAANRLGYWYFLDGAELPETMSGGCPNRVVLYIENRGFAKAYHKYSMRVKLEGDMGCFIEEADCGDNRTWAAGEIAKIAFDVHPMRTMQGNYMLSVGLFEGERPIELAMKNGADGYYPVGKVMVI
ncbi:MAG: DUF4832 domain-containing protein [Clostridia bacterium]|nr:DUF4832 domain-containing protein [Clostridia bacterium]